MSLLPEAYEKSTIRGMLPGDKGYTTPWAMWADENRVLWINGGYTIQQKPGGTAHLCVKRTENGVIVYQDTIGDYKYQPGEAYFVGGADPLPVELR